MISVVALNIEERCSSPIWRCLIKRISRYNVGRTKQQVKWIACPRNPLFLLDFIKVPAYENRIRALEKRKPLMSEKMENCSRPLQGFDNTYRTAQTSLPFSLLAT
jgi:hypothetical protein